MYISIGCFVYFLVLSTFVVNKHYISSLRGPFLDADRPTLQLAANNKVV